MNDAPILSDDEPVSMPSMPTQWGGDPAALGRIDHYDILRKLGGGGFGVVYLAKDTASDVEVAIKTLHPLLKHNADEMDLLREKFRLVSRLSHPNIATALVLHPCRDINIRDDVARAELKLSPGDSVMVMRYAPGVTLSKWRRQFPDGVVPPDLALEIGRQVASALDYAHGEHIVHRDIKPENIMVETQDGGRIRARILDFGLAAEIRASMSRVSTEQGNTSGTHRYMAPEQWLGKKQDGRTDQYALACVLYELLSGAPPFAGVFETGDPMIMMATVKGEVPDEIEDAAPAVNAAILRALAKAPKDRFPSCGDFVKSLFLPKEDRTNTKNRLPDQPDTPLSQSGTERTRESSSSGKQTENEINLLKRKANLTKQVGSFSDTERNDQELGQFVSTAEEELLTANEALKCSRFDIVSQCLDQVESAIKKIQRVKLLRELDLQRSRKKNELLRCIDEVQRNIKEMERLAAQGSWYQSDINNWNRLFNKSVKLLQIPAERDNNPEAQLLLASLYDFSSAPPKHRDSGKSFHWLNRAAENGSAAAQYQMGILFEEQALDRSGPDSRQDLEFAERLFRSASEQGHCKSMLHLGVFMEMGLSGKSDTSEAEKWYENAVKKLGSEAYLQVAMWYRRCVINQRFVAGKLQDCSKFAIKWFKKAADAGEHEAFLSLGDIYWYGHGVSVDSLEAEKWYLKASEAGEREIMEKGKNRLKELRRSPAYWIEKVGKFFSR